MTETYETVLRSIVEAIVDSPESVELESTTDEMGVLVILRVAKDDMGKIIGKEGNMAKALRTILKVIGMKNNARVSLKVQEPYAGAS
jgi:predicted RNA-binding protein YlqC (UPF0109 family)